jgi:LPXTG-motif cell wall-anchored protein
MIRGHTPQFAIVLITLSIVAISVSALPADDEGSSSMGHRANGDHILYSTFIGGSGEDWAHDVEMGPDGGVYIAGYTSSFDFPTTQGVYQRVNKGQDDVFVLKVSADLSTIEWATLLGGSGRDIPWDLAIGPGGRLYVTGYTDSDDFPTSLFALSKTLGGPQDAFVFCMEADGTDIRYSTYLGGEDHDFGYSVLPLSDGSAYVAGHTESIFFPTMVDAYDRGLSGFSDAFVVRIGSFGTLLLDSTYLGGEYTESEPSLAMAGDGKLWMTGSTTSSDFPTTDGAIDGLVKLGRDIFVTEIKSDLTAIGYSTIMGGVGNDVPRSIDLGPDGKVLLAGFTSSPVFYTTLNAIDDTLQGETDGFITVLNVTTPSIEYSTYVGGEDFDVIRTARFDQSGLIRVTGYANSSFFPTTPDAYIRQKLGDDDHDAIYMELSLDESLTNHSTFLGHKRGDFGMDMVLGQDGLPIIVGHTRSEQFQVTGVALDTTYNGGGDLFLIKYVVDTAPPEFAQDLTPTEAETGGQLTFRVIIRDRLGVGDAQVVYLVDGGDETTLDLVGDVHFVQTIHVEQAATEITYRFLAWDRLGRFNQTVDKTVAVRDTIPPGMNADHTPDNASTGDPLAFAVDLTDNIAVRKAYVEYSYGDVEGNATLEEVSIPVGALGMSVMMPHDSLDPVRYRFTFTDVSGNGNSTPWRTIPVLDDDPPNIEAPDVPETATPGSIVTLVVHGTDNIGITVAQVEYTFGPLSPVVIEADPPFEPFIGFNIPVERGEEDDLVFTVTIEDAAGNQAVFPGVVSISDQRAPWIVSFTTHGNATTGDEIEVSWEAVDEVMVAHMWIRYRFGVVDSTDYEYLGVNEIRIATVTIPVPTDAEGTLWVIYGARDDSFNSNETVPVAIPVIDDDAPVPRAGGWDNIFHANKPVHLTSSASFDNIGIVEFQWVWTVPGMEDVVLNTTGAQEVLIDLEPGQYTIELRAFDAAGNMGTDTVVVTVQADIKNEIGNDSWLILAGVAAMVGVTGLYILYRRRRNR